MNDENVAAALAASEGGTGGKGGDAELTAELEKAKHSADVWRGHATKRAERIKELEGELARLKAKEQVAATVAEIPAEVKGDTPDETIAAALTGSKKLIDASSEATKEEIEKMRKEMAENNKRQFVRQLGANHAQFFEMVGPGGANEKLWQQFKQMNRETYASVMESQDTERFGVLVSQFCNQFGLKNPSGERGGTAVPEPANISGGQQIQGGGGDDKAEYTTQEYLKQLEAAEDARNAGDMKTYREVTSRLTKALNEGRVKDK